MTTTRTKPTAYSPAALARVRRSKVWRAVAWHEAGHAVASLAFGKGVRFVELTPGHPDHSGMCTGYVSREEYYGLGPSYWSDKLRWRTAVELYAGAVAERAFTGKLNHVVASSDYRAADDILLAIPPGDVGSEAADRLQRDGRAAAVELVQANRPAIEAIVEALLASDTLSLNGRQIRSAVGDMIVRATRKK